MKSITILPRRDLEERWLTNNPILRESEFAVSVDNGTIKYKLGDGCTPYNQLPFIDLFNSLTSGIIYTPDSTVKIRLIDDIILTPKE